MSQGFGREVPAPHKQRSHRQAAKYLVVIDSGGVGLARLFVASYEQVAECDAATEEVASMVKGLRATHGALGPEWDRALAGHSLDERRDAKVYQLLS